MQVLDFAFPAGSVRGCRVRVGVGVSEQLVEQAAAGRLGRPLVLVSDSNVAALHTRGLLQRFRERGLDPRLIEFPTGESSKTRATKEQIEDRLLELGAGRETVLCAVGGGVTGDLVGFVAATWHRGVPVHQIPTSLLSMVDASLGGKTAVNLGGAKNLIGCFHQPSSIYADISFLSTLPDAEIREGLAEAVKTAVIGDAALFRWLEASAALLLDRDAAALEHVVVACMKLKGRVVKRDEREQGRRAILNFGHTVAHAIEKVSSYGVRHGSAVAVGMCVEARIASAVTGLSRQAVARLEALLQKLGLPISVPTDLTLDAIVAATAFDKKVRGGEVRYALPQGIGRMPPGAEVTVAADEALLSEALRASQAAPR